MKDPTGLRFSVPLVLLAILAAVPARAQYCGVPGHNGSYLNARYGFEVEYAGGWHRLQVGAREDEFR